MPRWTNPKLRGMPAASVMPGPGRGLPRVLASFQKFRTELLAQRGRLDQQIQGIDGLIAALQGRTRIAALGEGRSARAGSLKAHIQQVLQRHRKPMGIGEITRAVLDNGYVTSNKTLGTTVGITLVGMPDVRRVSRGVYSLR